MSNYFDNQTHWSWSVSNEGVYVSTDHGSHTHTLNLSNTTLGDMVDHTGQVMGDAHRAASHDFKEDAKAENTEENTVGAQTQTESEATVAANSESAVEDDCEDTVEDSCEDGLDF